MNLNRIPVLALLHVVTVAVQAQNTASFFFNEGYMFRHNINPAVGNPQSYFALPLIGNVNLSLHSTVGVGDLVYSQKGKTVSFLHPDVNSDKATRPFKNDVRIEQGSRIDLLSMGFSGASHRGYTTLSIGLRDHVSLCLPGQIFCAAKEGVSNLTYDLSPVNAHADVFGEVAIGHSHKIGEHLELGGKFKFLIGGANIDATAKGTQLKLGEDLWSATVNAQMQASVKGLNYITDTENPSSEYEQIPHTFVDDVNIDKYGVNGFGAAIDLGAIYSFGQDLKLGVALLDIGGIRWNNNMLASTDGPHYVCTDAYKFSVDSDDDNSFKKEFDRLGDAAKGLYELKDMGDQGSRFVLLGATLNASLEYKMPFYRKMSVGVLSTTRFQGKRTWNEERISLNLAPIDWFAVSLTTAVGTFGTSFGGGISFHPNGFCIYAGADGFGTPYSKEGVPLGHNIQGNFGIVLPF